MCMKLPVVHVAAVLSVLWFTASVGADSPVAAGSTDPYALVDALVPRLTTVNKGEFGFAIGTIRGRVPEPHGTVWWLS